MWVLYRVKFVSNLKQYAVEALNLLMTSFMYLFASLYRSPDMSLNVFFASIVSLFTSSYLNRYICKVNIYEVASFNIIHMYNNRKEMLSMITYDLSRYIVDIRFNSIISIWCFFNLFLNGVCTWNRIKKVFNLHKNC